MQYGNFEDLMELSQVELAEVLLQDKYNKALLRELIRRSLKLAELYKKVYEYEKEVSKKLPLRYLMNSLEFAAYKNALVI